MFTYIRLVIFIRPNIFSSPGTHHNDDYRKISLLLLLLTQFTKLSFQTKIQSSFSEKHKSWCCGRHSLIFKETLRKWAQHCRTFDKGLILLKYLKLMHQFLHEMQQTEDKACHDRQICLLRITAQLQRERRRITSYCFAFLDIVD